ncbi:hypothetical protein [Guptibacillus hwajinpoensis]|uniref:hypothetical protein n=1 Tax=Guptibacillus hwajinpoensis TaxID=208199 RepID=UPI0024B3C7CF|nr:hypothetical protein [Pseudalkalibacillus hwajinpoensis]
MNTKRLDLIILLTMIAAVPECTILPYLGMIPDLSLFFILPHRSNGFCPTDTNQ